MADAGAPRPRFGCRTRVMVSAAVVERGLARRRGSAAGTPSASASARVSIAAGAEYAAVPMAALPPFHASIAPVTAAELGRVLAPGLPGRAAAAAHGARLVRRLRRARAHAGARRQPRRRPATSTTVFRPPLRARFPVRRMRAGRALRRAATTARWRPTTRRRSTAATRSAPGPEALVGARLRRGDRRQHRREPLPRGRPRAARRRAAPSPTARATAAGWRSRAASSCARSRSVGWLWGGRWTARPTTSTSPASGGGVHGPASPPRAGRPAREVGKEPRPDERERDRQRAAGDDGRHGSDQRCRDPRLERAELVRRADEHALDGVDAPAQWFGVASATVVERMFIENMSTKPLTASASAETRNQRERPKTIMLAPNAPTTSSSVRPAWPPSGLRASRIAGDQRADGDRAAQHAEAERPGVEDRLCEERQQRDGAAEEHREEVERDRAEHDRRRADEADPAEQARRAAAAREPRAPRPRGAVIAQQQQRRGDEQDDAGRRPLRAGSRRAGRRQPGRRSSRSGPRSNAARARRSAARPARARAPASARPGSPSAPSDAGGERERDERPQLVRRR